MSDIVKKSFTPEEAEEQVRVMARLFGLMFYHFAETIVKKHGADEGKSLVREAVRRFGLDRGEKMRREAVKAGLDPNLKNFARVSDLPKIGWGGETRETYCPLAQVWIEKNAEDLCKLYCDVDVWKMIGYNPEIKVKRLGWVLEGARDCKYEIE
ncbi:L-2-amino-thiazoline-4-carboxylic acid hydrolase [Candidatus Bathyarchaeota archaeon]|nr:L-2-amino-thiazoline-4-carboxylic acid hydrolase [Candidatus Bathyarchaeota archaeon]